MSKLSPELATYENIAVLLPKPQKALPKTEYTFCVVCLLLYVALVSIDDMARDFVDIRQTCRSQ